MSEFNITFKIKAKHGIIYKYIRDNNLTIENFSKEINISVATIMAMLHFRWIPNTKYPQGRLIIQKLESFFHLSIAEIFPEILCDTLKNNKEIAKALRENHDIDKTIDLEMLPYHQMVALPSSENIDSGLEREELLKILSTELTPKEERIIKMRYGIDNKNGDHTLAEIADIFNLSKARIKQIEAKALRKLRHPTRLSREVK